jgi:hypothetical protein
MKRILKTSILSFIFCLSAFIFTQSASASCCGSSCCGSGSCYSCCGSGNCYSCCGPTNCYRCLTYSYDNCNCCYYPTVTYYRSYCAPCTGCTYDCCGYPKYYTYYKRYSCPVRSIRYYTPVSACCNPCSQRCGCY